MGVGKERKREGEGPAPLRKFLDPPLINVGSIAYRDRTSDSWSRGRGFESYSLCSLVRLRISHSGRPGSATKQYNLVLVEGRWWSEAIEGLLYRSGVALAMIRYRLCCLYSPRAHRSNWDRHISFRAWSSGNFTHLYFRLLYNQSANVATA